MLYTGSVVGLTSDRGIDHGKTDITCLVTNFDMEGLLIAGCDKGS